SLVAAAMKEGATCLEFNSAIPWLEPFFELGGERHPAQFVLMPKGEHWKLRGVPPTYERRMDVRNPFPESWAGLLDEDLKRVSGIPGAIFCHKGRFISVWETREDALRALRMMTNTSKEKENE
ncbi:MAG: MYG1 family protein, partial [Chlamydiia bacterium]|nr:MYG1 family protein [Chlamydiia bacterium]